MEDTYDWIRNNRGLNSLEDYPYRAVYETCKSLPESYIVKVKNKTILKNNLNCIGRGEEFAKYQQQVKEQ